MTLPYDKPDIVLYITEVCDGGCTYYDINNLSNGIQYKHDLQLSTYYNFYRPHDLVCGYYEHLEGRCRYTKLDNPHVKKLVEDWIELTHKTQTAIKDQL